MKYLLVCPDGNFHPAEAAGRRLRIVRRWFIPGRASNPGKNGRDFAPYEGFVPYGDYGSAVKERRLAVTLKRGLLRKNRSQ